MNFVITVGLIYYIYKILDILIYMTTTTSKVELETTTKAGF
jgi:hypothetical protein